MLARFLGRLIMVPLGFLLAGLAAAGVLLTLGLERLTQVFAGHGAVEGSFDDVVVVVRFVWVIASSLTLLPALGLIVVGEVARIRSPLYYIAGGGIALAAIPLLARIGQAGGFTMPATAIWQVFATAGFAGGLVYWLVAGRRA